ncbi:MAG: hypothetical protein BWY74_00587 [Firmicutes bacterium ADurb.Bin419]|nr:MAG: hypothetical protein BWY74_00587 [Firmicutes bacterium ADurb.Bin419]
MKREEALEHFIENYVKAESSAKMQKLKSYYENNKNTLKDDFIESFRRICVKIKDLQERGKKGKIGYITYSLLRTNIMEGKLVYLIEGFNRLWFFDREECQEEYDVSWAYKFLDEFEAELVEKSKFYLNKITKPDIERFKLKETALYNNLIVEFAKEAMHGASELEELSGILKEEIFEVRVGEYKGASEVVYE